MKEIVEIIKQIVEIVGIISGIIVAVPLFRKKILDEKLNETLKQLNVINKQNLPEVIKLIDKYTYREENFGGIPIKEIQMLYKDFFNLKRGLAFSQSEIATISSLLEGFIRRTIHWYQSSSKNGRIFILERTDLYAIVIKSLWDIHFFMLKDIPVPNNTFLKKDTFVNESIKKFTTKSQYNKYLGFEIGYSSDKTSSIFPLFLENVNKYGNEIYYKSLLDIYGTDIQFSIVRLLYLKKIYSPIFLKFYEQFCGNCYLNLLGFKIKKNLSDGEAIVDLYYGNPVSNIEIKGIVSHFGINSFKDIYLNYNNTIPDNSDIHYCGFNIYKIAVKQVLLEKEFIKYKKIIEMKMTNECKGVFTY